VAALQLASTRPFVNSLTTLTPIAGSMSFASDGSDVTQPGVLVPLSGAMNTASDVVAILRTGFAGPGTTNMFITGTLPLVYSTTAGQCMPGTATLTMIGQPAVNSLYSPDDYHVVVIPQSNYVVEIPG
jgi:hypothetical protein